MINNPFPKQSDRWEIWEMLVRRDIKAFLSSDWSIVMSDFLEDNFIGLNADGKSNPDDWKLAFPTLDDYKKSWLKQAGEFAETQWAEDPETALFRVTELKNIEIVEDTAAVHKKFFGGIKMADGKVMKTNWQTIYYCKKVQGKWRISGFTGYLPHFQKNQKTMRIPEGASQHKTAGPYSPVLEVDPAKLVVISGQAAINPAGEVVGDSIEEQTRLTLDNCATQLAFAGCTLDDVFKVNVYLEDLDEWPLFNEVYKEYFQPPLPVRTAVQAGLLTGLKVELEMWASKNQD